MQEFREKRKVNAELLRVGLWSFVVSCVGMSETDVKKYCNTYSDGWSHAGMTHGHPMTGRRQSAVSCRAEAEKISFVG